MEIRRFIFRRSGFQTGGGRGRFTYQGRTEIAIHAGEEFYSDAVNLPVLAGNEIMVDIFVGEALEIGSVCTTFSAGGWSAWYKRCQPEGEGSGYQRRNMREPGFARRNGGGTFCGKWQRNGKSRYPAGM